MTTDHSLYVFTTLLYITVCRIRSNLLEIPIGLWASALGVSQTEL